MSKNNIGSNKYNLKKMENNTKLFTIDDVLEQVQLINKSLAAPYVDSTYSTFGGVSNISIMITISLDSKENWAGGILQNSRYAKFHLSNNGRLEMFAGSTPKKMRRSVIASVQDAIKKINTYLIMPEKYEDGGNILEGKQTSYPPASQSGFSLNTLVPVSMYNELKLFNQFLRTFIATEYNMTVVQYVATKLHYKSVDDLFFSFDRLDDKGKPRGRFSIEQIDAIATAIYNHEINGNSIIIADQTGVGKGRTAAGLIRYTILELQSTPIFITEKKHLIVDIYRDLIDIGFEANIPLLRRTYVPKKLEEYSDAFIIKMIKEDYRENDDFRVEYKLPEENENDEKNKPKSWFTKEKFKAFPRRKKIEKGQQVEIFKDDEEFEKYEDLYEDLIVEYRQKLIEEGYVDEIDEVVSELERNELIKQAEAQGKKVLVPFNPSSIDIVTETDNPNVVNVIHKRLKSEELKLAYGYKQDGKNLVYDFETPPINQIFLPEKFNLVTIPYSQIDEITENYLGQKKESPKFTFYKRVAAGIKKDGSVRPSVLICDESHNAAGGSQTFMFLSELIARARMTTFLSATYAKRPDNMPLYAKGTSLKESGLSTSDMIEVFDKGSVALQEAVSAELTRNGQILRREKLIQGKTNYFYVYDDSVMYDGQAFGTQQRIRLDRVASIFEDITNFGLKVREVVRDYRREEDDISISNARSIRAMTFQLFNFFIIGIKLDQLKYEIINKMTNGRKLVITVANTLESALKNMSKTFKTDSPNDKYKIGEPIENDFKLYLAHLLFSTMRFKEEKMVTADDGTTVSENETHCVFDSNHKAAGYILEELGEEYDSLLDKILKLKTYIPIAPIDVIKSFVQGYKDADGYVHSIDEITGRSLVLDFVYYKIDEETGEKTNEIDYSIGKISKRNIKPTTEIVKSFNSNVIDHLIINKSGATGISMHPRPVGQAQIYYPTTMVEEIDEDGNKQELEVGFPLKLENKQEIKKRCMLVLQMELDINAEVQKLGRISRTGQVYTAEYTYIVSSIPSESRLTAMMEKKLRSLSANVSSNQEQANDLFSADDFFGDIAVIPFKNTVRDLRIRIQAPEINKGVIKEYTKILYFSPFDFQKRFYDTFAKELKKHKAEEEANGNYVGKMALKDYNASFLFSKPFYIGNEMSKTSFGRHSTISKIEVDERISKSTEASIKDEIDERILKYSTKNGGSGKYAGNEYIAFEDLDDYKNKLISKAIEFSKNKIDGEEEDISRYKASIEEDFVYLSTLQKEFDAIKSKAEKDLDYLSNFNLDSIKLIQDIEEKKKIFEPIKIQMQEAQEKLDGLKMNELREPFLAISNEIKILEQKLNEMKEKIGLVDDNITQEKIENQIQIKQKEIEGEIKYSERQIEKTKKIIYETREKIESRTQKINEIKALKNIVIKMIQSIGGVFIYSQYEETPAMIGDNDEYISYFEYDLKTSTNCVITNVNIQTNFVPSEYSIDIISLNRSTKNIKFTEIFDNFNKKEKEANRKPTHKLSFQNETYLKWWDNNVVKKTAQTKRVSKWMIVGNILRGYKGVMDISLPSTITKFTTIDKKERLGIEIKDNKKEGVTLSTYQMLEASYMEDSVGSTVLFDGNTQNFLLFIQGFLYDEYIGNTYDAHRKSEPLLLPEKIHDKYMFQIAKKGVFLFIVVIPNNYLLDYSRRIVDMVRNGSYMNDVSEMDEETFVSNLSIKIIADNHTVTDAFFEASINAGLSYYDVEYGFNNRYSKYKSDKNIITCGKKFPRFINFRGAYYKNVIPVNKEIIDSVLANKSDLEKEFDTISMSFENYLIVVDYLSGLNAKPVYGVKSKYYQKYEGQFQLNDILEEKVTTTENLPTDAEGEIYEMIEQLIQLL